MKDAGTPTGPPPMTVVLSDIDTRWNGLVNMTLRY